MKTKHTYLKVLLWLLLASVGSILVGLSGTYLYLSPKLPSVESLRDVRLQTPLRIYTNDNKLIGEFGTQRRTPVRFEQIPKQYINALLAAEDSSFFSHHGVSIKGISRAVVELITTGKKGSGGSTLTMQVARNYFLTPTKAFIRKFNEILLAIKIEQSLSKEEILELYVNVTFLGKHAYGIAAAGKVYYGKELDELSLAQLAMIAGLPQGPSYQNPIANPARAVERRNWILGRMYTLKMITSKEYETAKSEAITAKYHRAALDLHAPYIAELARQEALELIGESAYTDGYKVYTSVSSTLQDAAINAVQKGLIAYDQRHGYRGPEMRLSVDNIVTLEDEDKNTSADYQNWVTSLKQLPVFKNLAPAAVTQIDDKRLHALLSNGNIITLEWDNGLSDTRPYISPSRRKAKISQVSDAFSVGDVIRVEQKNNSFHLSQIPKAQAALVALDPLNGGIRALVGGFDFKQSHFIRATQSQRQPGSSFKPFIYTVALENGFTPATLINDAPLVLDDKTLENTWRPENDGGKFYGPTRMRKALYRSINLVSIRILREVGIRTLINSLDRFGFDTKALPANLSLALGSHAQTPLNMAKAWSVIANGGYQVEPFLIEKISDIEGTVAYQANPKVVCEKCNKHSDLLTHAESSVQTAPSSLNENASEQTEQSVTNSNKYSLEAQYINKAPQVLDDRVAYIIDSMLKDVIKKGTGYKAKTLNRSDLAGKTGTTNGPRDAWFSGYSSNIVTTTWVGFDDNTELGRNEYGGSAALPIWIDFMREATRNAPIKTRPQPPGLVTIKIDPDTGKRARVNDPDAIFEIFRAENTPPLNVNSNNTGNNASPLEEVITEELF